MKLEKKDKISIVSLPIVFGTITTTFSFVTDLSIASGTAAAIITLGMYGDVRKRLKNNAAKKRVMKQIASELSSIIERTGDALVEEVRFQHFPLREPSEIIAFTKYTLGEVEFIKEHESEVVISEAIRDSVVSSWINKRKASWESTAMELGISIIIHDEESSQLGNRVLIVGKSDYLQLFDVIISRYLTVLKSRIEQIEAK